VYRSGPPFFTFFTKVLSQNPINGFFLFRPCRDRKKPRWFIHHQEVMIFVEEEETMDKAAHWRIFFFHWALTPPVTI
jgi:hypothetical protein